MAPGGSLDSALRSLKERPRQLEWGALAFRFYTPVGLGIDMLGGQLEVGTPRQLLEKSLKKKIKNM